MLTTLPQDTSILRRVTFARSKDRNKESLNALVIDPAGPGKVVVAATDGHLLAWGTLRLAEQDAILSGRVIVPGRLADAMAALRDTATPTAYVEITPGQVRLVRPGHPTLLMQPLTCTFPAWSKVIPSTEGLQPLTRCTFSTAMIERASKALGCDFLRLAVYSDRHTAIAEHNGVFVQTMPESVDGDDAQDRAEHVSHALQDMAVMSA